MNILIAIPTATGNIPAQLVRDLFYVDKPCPVGLGFISRAMVDVARNKLAIQALEHGFDYILFLDDDMTLPRDAITKLLEADKDIIAGITVSRHDKMPCAFNSKKEGELTLYKTITKLDAGVTEVDAVGTGLVLVKRKVLEEMAKKYGQFMFEFSKENVGNEVNQKGEDVTFCERAKDLGFKVWVHGDVKPGHQAPPEYLIYQ